jgi:hypothetical protein
MYRRIAYANQYFGSGFAGWRSDRGRIYITFGPPDEREENVGGGMYQRPMDEGGGFTQTYPFERWRYRYLEEIGTNIEIEFVDKSLTGEFRMAMDPSEKDALINIPGAGLTHLEAMGMASKVDRVLGIEHQQIGQGSTMRPYSPSKSRFERMDQFVKLQRPPPVKFKDLEEVVGTRISYNLFPFEVRTDFVRVTSSTVLAALTVQVNVKDMTFEDMEGIQRGLVNVFGRVTTLTGRVVQTFEDVIHVDVPAEQLELYLNQKRVYWQGMPLRSGLYRLDLVLKDIHSGNMGTSRMALRVPRYYEDTLAASSLILADRLERVSTRQIGKGQFVIGSTKVRPSVEEKFSRNQRLGIYLQVYNLATDEKTRKPSATVEYALQKNGQTLFQLTENSDQIKGAFQQITVEKLLPLESLEPGRYKLQVKVTDRIKKQSITPTATFTIQ